MIFRRTYKVFLLCLALCAFTSCVRTARDGVRAVPKRAQTFSSAAQAAATFDQVVQAGDTQGLLRILGPHGAEIVESGDAIADHHALAEFAHKMREQNRLELQANGDYLILVGRDEWPFPIPLIQSKGRWLFDTLQGKEEILNRRIGENELKTIRVSRTYVEAQKEYFKKDRNGDGVREYAQRMASTLGKRDGLYWKVENPKEQSPLGPFAAEAAAEGYRRKESEPVPYHGYIYRILTEQGPSAFGGQKKYINKRGQMTSGFALVAYPARWGSSGIMTFIVNQDGLVFEKDLGVQTLTSAQNMQDFNPDSSWSLADPLNEEAMLLAE